jgi:anthranilate synthase component 2
MLLIIDNYDSFTFNLVQAFGILGETSRVVRNDRITLDEIAQMDPTRIVISPGPGDPWDAGISLEVIRRFSGSRDILGVCLGHQCIGAAFGARVVHAPRPMHGKTSLTRHEGTSLFRGLPSPLVVARYHSLVVSRRGLPRSLETIATAEDGTIMALRHRERRLVGVQFHPESFLTPRGLGLLRNFLAGRL